MDNTGRSWQITVTKRRFKRRKIHREKGLQVHLLDKDGQARCSRMRGYPMKQTGETVTCHACIGLLRQENLPKAN